MFTMESRYVRLELRAKLVNYCVLGRGIWGIGRWCLDGGLIRSAGGVGDDAWNVLASGGLNCSYLGRNGQRLERGGVVASMP